MLIVRAPFRVSLAGGGTDLDAYAHAYGGLVVSTTIDKYAYAIARPIDSDVVQLTSSDYQTFIRHDPAKPSNRNDLALPRAILDEIGPGPGLGVFLATETPPGTGLGSSASVTVALAQAMLTVRSQRPGRSELADLACRVKIERLGQTAGRQDEYAAVFGGLNVIRFARDGVTVEPLLLPMPTERALERRLHLFYTGLARDSGTILREQAAQSAKSSGTSVEALHEIKRLAAATIDFLRTGDLDGYGRLLHQSWMAKRQVAAGISNPEIDRWYDAARDAGALGGKIAGAGGGGFLLLYVPDAAVADVRATMEANGLSEFEFAFEGTGVSTLVDTLPRAPRESWLEHHQRPRAMAQAGALR